jgi:hypothetical protein
MRIKGVVFFLLLLLPPTLKSQDQQFIGLGVLPTYSYFNTPSSTPGILRPEEQGAWSTNFQVSYRTHLNPHWSLQATIQILMARFHTSKQPLQWPSEFDPATGGYKPDPNLPKFLSFTTIYQSLAAPIELYYLTGKRLRWGISFGLVPSIPLGSRIGSIFYFSDGRETRNLSSMEQPFSLQLGASVGIPVLFPLGSHWQLELQPKFIGSQFGRTVAPQHMIYAGGTVQLFRQLGVKPMPFWKKRRAIVPPISPVER